MRQLLPSLLLVALAGCGGPAPPTETDTKLIGDLFVNGAKFDPGADNDIIRVTLTGPGGTYYGGFADGRLVITLPSAAKPVPGLYKVGVRKTSYNDQRTDKLKDVFDEKRTPLRLTLSENTTYIKIDIGNKTVKAEEGPPPGS